ncbi:Protein of uncharacterised function (DUF2971) [Yersinia intermedia]|uniref:DUF2971 domain-containing protein n=1 Tax=Yersinia intermedia TaxID=631 RepID=UPI0005E03836|nr:DUF2971 domain-containing protein [Yersinia intermedia]CQJ57517.1 Protein of uncharacterised function (DUF2971) [Yersinia intermedia]
MTQNIPARLYKYKSFSVDSLDLLVSDRLYFADPTTFNDPLDCNPSVKNDIDDVDMLNAILYKLVKDNHQKELEEAAAKVKYRGPKTLEKIETLGKNEARKIINDIAWEVDFFDELHGESTCNYIKQYLLKNYAVGVLSLAKDFNNPLMWSHYADQHKGFCIGYDVSVNELINIHPVDYNGERFIRTQQVYNMLFNDNDDIKKEAKEAVEKVILLNKAPSWKYENEYRVINKQGLRDSQFRLSDVTFGLRFNESAKFSVMSALQSRQGKIDFYEMSLCNDSFSLKRELIDLDNFEVHHYPTSNYELNHDMNQALDD